MGTYSYRRILMSLEIQGMKEVKYKPIFCKGDIYEDKIFKGS
jgi:hypothetical protein